MTAKQATFLVNGVQQDRVSILDRGLQYGDGVFETITVHEGRLCYWRRHWSRLLTGCTKLAISPPKEADVLRDCMKLCTPQTAAVIKIIVTRGEGGRGYQPPETKATSCIIGLHPWLEQPLVNYRKGILLFLCKTPLAPNPLLAGIKHLNRLEQVLGSSEFDSSKYAEGLMLDTDGGVIEGTRSNLFMVKDNKLTTPALDRCGVSGVMRSVVLELAAELNISCRIEAMDLEQVKSADEIFITNSLIGIQPVRGLEQTAYPVGPVTRRLMEALNGATQEKQ